MKTFLKMDELVDILDEKGNYTGQTELKSKAHFLGLFHPTIHVWCYSVSGKVLLQQRGANKETYPLKWDVSVAGHIGAGESAELGAFRETHEEIGVTVNSQKLEKITVLKKETKHNNGIWDREFVHVYLYLLDEKTVLTKQQSEVEDLQWISLEEFKSWVIKEDQRLISLGKERHLRLVKAIKSRL